MVKDITMDMAYEILQRLPVKTLKRFQCVCKSWYSLISHPSFKKDYHHRSHQNPLLLMTKCKPGEDSNTKTLHFSAYTKEGTLVNKFSKIVLPQCASKYCPIQSCRGLVCIGPKYFGHKGHILLCNPSTEELITLPPTKEVNRCIGFGYAASKKEFKVVRFFYKGSRDCCQVYALGTSEWRDVKCPPPTGDDTYYWCAPFLHGALHWLPTMYGPNEDDFIHAFDIEIEEYTKLPLPEYYHSAELRARHIKWICLQDLGGSLCLNFHLRTSLVIWCLKDYNNGRWAKEYSIDLTSVIPDWVHPLVIMVDGRILLSIEMTGCDDSLYYYNCRDNNFSSKIEENDWALLYEESFFSLRSSL